MLEQYVVVCVCVCWEIAVDVDPGQSREELKSILLWWHPASMLDHLPSGQSELGTVCSTFSMFLKKVVKIDKTRQLS